MRDIFRIFKETWKLPCAVHLSELVHYTCRCGGRWMSCIVVMTTTSAAVLQAAAATAASYVFLYSAGGAMSRCLISSWSVSTTCRLTLVLESGVVSPAFTRTQHTNTCTPFIRSSSSSSSCHGDAESRKSSNTVCQWLGVYCSFYDSPATFV